MVRAEVDIHAHRQFALVTALLVGVIVAAALHVFALGDDTDSFLQANGAVPDRILALLHWRHPYRSLSALQTIAGSLLLHATWLQVAISVVLLLAFGASVEDRIGHYRFSLLFFVAGSVAVLHQCLLTPESHVALVGAQGGIAGVAGAWFALGPRTRVPTMIRGLEIPWVFGPILWLAGQSLSATADWTAAAGVGTVDLPTGLLAFGAGLVLGPLYRSRRPALLRG